MIRLLTVLVLLILAVEAGRDPGSLTHLAIGETQINPLLDELEMFGSSTAEIRYSQLRLPGRTADSGRPAP